jgi:hypothetical protein
MYFPDELWNEIKDYAGIYNITLNWDLMKLPKELIIIIIKKNIDANIEYHDSYLREIKRNMGSIKKFLIQYFWKNINKAKLLTIYKNYTCKYCPYDYKLYNLNDVYLLENYKKKINFSFNGEITFNLMYIERPFKIINITKKYIELISLNEDKTEEQQKIKIKKNIYGSEKL